MIKHRMMELVKHYAAMEHSYEVLNLRINELTKALADLLVYQESDDLSGGFLRAKAVQDARDVLVRDWRGTSETTQEVADADGE